MAAEEQKLQLKRRERRGHGAFHHTGFSLLGKVSMPCPAVDTLQRSPGKETSPQRLPRPSKTPIQVKKSLREGSEHTGELAVLGAERCSSKLALPREPLQPRPLRTRAALALSRCGLPTQRGFVPGWRECSCQHAACQVHPSPDPASKGKVQVCELRTWCRG